MFKSSVAFAAVMLLSSPAFAGTLCVNPNGTNGCEKTIQSAINSASPGDVINVARGTYAGNVIVDRSIALLGAGASSTVIDATGSANGIHVDGLDNAGLSSVIIRGFRIQNANFQGILVTNASDVTIRENHVTGNDRAVQIVPNAQPNCPGLPAYLVAFESEDCGEGIQLSGVTSSTVADNVVDHNTGGILVTDDTAPNHDNLITHNLVQDNPYDCSITLATHDLNPAQGLPAKGVYRITVKGNTVLRNGLATNEGAGVGIFAPTPGSQNYGNVVVDNILGGNGLPGVTLHSHAPGTNVGGHVIANNTIYGNGIDPASRNMKAGIAISGDPGTGPINGIQIVGNKIFGEDVDIVFAGHGELSVHENSFFDDIGVANFAPASAVDATLNWWKCASGPGNPGCASTQGLDIQVAPVLARPDRDDQDHPE